MKSLQNRLYECTLHECPLYEGFYKNAGGMVRPSTKKELQEEIEIRLKRGQTNLNDIDTSKITDMNSLFMQFSLSDLSKLDISLWNTHNVINMRSMFYGCTNFNSDLSKWNISNVQYMAGMFTRSGMKEFPAWYDGWV